MSATVEQAMRLMGNRKAALVGGDEPAITTNPDAARLLSVGFDVDPEELECASITFAREAVGTIIMTSSPYEVLTGFFMDALLTGYVMGAGIPEGVES